MAEPQRTNKANTKDRISGGKFFLIAIIGALIQAGVAQYDVSNHLPSTLLILWFIVAIMVGFPFFLKSSNATKPNIYVYGTIFFASTTFSILGIIAAYAMFKGKGLTE